MTVLRRVARPLLASMFVSGGFTAVRDPQRLAPAAAPVADALSPAVAPRTSLLPEDPERLVRLNGAVQLGAGLLLALGRAPRLASAALAVTLVPTTLAAHRYWEIEDPEERSAQRTHFLKNASLLGALLIAAADTHGKPSFAYRTRHAAAHASDTVAHRAHRAADLVGGATGGAVDSVTGAVEAARKRLP
ncbi:DoxX family membrane protein [Streptomyces sp. SID8356]|uniref:DoxX family membrane protein n=1 Tax=unclassified Streptomyces TaxID=2593676 RepID=UPI0004769844|nr:MULTISPECIES: DoxX family membrane protein [unclassified Streptomyces]MYT37993.1 DoxX family membrane protein [Streptomyces sp. SID8356]